MNGHRNSTKKRPEGAANTPRAEHQKKGLQPMFETIVHQRRVRRVRDRLAAYDVKRAYWALRMSHALCSNPQWCKPYSPKHYAIFLQICIPLDVNQWLLDEVWEQEKRAFSVFYERALFHEKLQMGKTS
jgi:hypothetical protein